MEFRVLGSFGGSSPMCLMTSFLVDRVVVVDAGSVTHVLTLEEQKRVRHVLVSHSHMDHTCCLPFLVANTVGANDGPLAIYAIKEVVSSLRRGIFNGDMWPDFTRIPRIGPPALKFVEVEPGVPFVIEGLPGGDLEVTPVPVNHAVPTTGFLLKQGSTSVLFSSDTGPTDELWRMANVAKDLSAVIVECSFPNRMKRLALESMHLTPELLGMELAKLDKEVPVYIWHMKPPYVAELRRELAESKLPHPVAELKQGHTYTF